MASYSVNFWTTNTVYLRTFWIGSNNVLSNTLGGIIGIGIYAWLSKVIKGRTNKVINVLAVVVTILALLLVAFLLASHRWVRIK